MGSQGRSRVSVDDRCCLTPTASCHLSHRAPAPATGSSARSPARGLPPRSRPTRPRGCGARARPRRRPARRRASRRRGPAAGRGPGRRGRAPGRRASRPAGAAPPSAARRAHERVQVVEQRVGRRRPSRSAPGARAPARATSTGGIAASTRSVPPRRSSIFSSSAAGYPSDRRRKKRSICDSGSGYVPRYSTGFCVATTMKGCGQRAPLRLDGDRALVHRLEQRRLRLRRGAVDLVGEHDVREDRPGVELEAVASGRGRPRSRGRRPAACRS